MQRLFEVLPAIAASPSTVLIQGETGTGKELVARTIHELSPRKDAPFVAVNCGALPDTLLESELFGYKAGAFTGATKNKPGRFALAKGGTLLLDEIGEVSPALQVRLLRVLQERVYEPLGATRSEKADVRDRGHEPGSLAPAKGTFAKTSTTVSTWCVWNCRRCVGVKRTSRYWWSSSSRGSTGCREEM